MGVMRRPYRFAPVDVPSIHPCTIQALYGWIALDNASFVPFRSELRIKRGTCTERPEQPDDASIQSSSNTHCVVVARRRRRFCAFKCMY